MSEEWKLSWEKRKRISILCGHLGRSHSIRLANLEAWTRWGYFRYTNTCVGRKNILRGIFPKRKGFLVQECWNVTLSLLSRKSIWLSMSFLSKRVSFEIYYRNWKHLRFFSIKTRFLKWRTERISIRIEIIIRAMFDRVCT